MQLANAPPLQSTTLGLHHVSTHQMATPLRGSRHPIIPITAYYLFIDLERIKAELVGWHVADGLPTLVAIGHQVQDESQRQSINWAQKRKNLFTRATLC